LENNISFDSYSNVRLVGKWFSPTSSRSKL